MRSRRLVTRRTASAQLTPVAAGTPEEVVRAAILVEGVATLVEGVAILGVEAAILGVEAAGREAEDVWAAGEDKAIAAEAT